MSPKHSPEIEFELSDQELQPADRGKMAGGLFPISQLEEILRAISGAFSPQKADARSSVSNPLVPGIKPNDQCLSASDYRSKNSSRPTAWE